MIDKTTNKPMRVTTDDPVFPYIRLLLSQVDEVRRLLDSRGIRYSVSENAISLDGGPYMTRISLGRGGDAVAAQGALDSSVE